MTSNLEPKLGSMSPLEALSQAWEAIKPQYWLFFGMVVVSMLMLCVPILNIFLFSFVAYGFHYAMLHRMRGEQADFSMLFKGFENFGQVFIACLISLVPSLINLAVSFVMPQPDFTPPVSQDPQILIEFYRKVLATTLLTPTNIVLTIFGIAWAAVTFFILPMMADKKVDALTAFGLSARAGLSNVLWIILLYILHFLLSVAGFIALCVGIFFVFPIILGSITTAYRQVFPDDKSNQATNAPPNPNYYGSEFGTANNPSQQNQGQQNYGQPNAGQQNYPRPDYGRPNPPQENPPSNWQPPNNDPKNWNN